MERLPLLSIIVPVYNAEKFLEKCIYSILNQKYKNVEVLLINDGSTDSSLEICKAFEKEDSRIIVISQPNGGIGKARNMGLINATGEYLTFVDSDDWVDSTIYSDTLPIMVDNGLDMGMYGMYTVFGDVTIPYEFPNIPNATIERIVDKKTFLREMFDDKDACRWCVWNKIYKRSSISGLLFKEYNLAEDLFFSLDIFNTIDTPIFYSNTPKYYWNRGDYISASRKGFQIESFLNLEYYLSYRKFALEYKMDDLADQCYSAVFKRTISYMARGMNKGLNNEEVYLKWKKWMRQHIRECLLCSNLQWFYKIDYILCCLFPNFINRINQRILSE